jgi:nucleoside-diphosphate-sugar epimerase
VTADRERVFVTGGSGFIGRHLLPRLRARGTVARALARSPAASAALSALGAEPVRGALHDLAALQSGMAGCSAVFHLAAHVREWGTVQEFLEANVQGTKNALDAARAAGVARFIHVGTEAVLLGSGPLVGLDETRQPVAHPPGLYPWTKALAERAVLEASGGALATMVVRPRFVWGRGDTTLLPKMVDAVRAGRFAWVGGGGQLTSTCHVENVCEGLLAAADRGKAGEIYFVTDGEPVVTKEFVTAMLRTAGVDPGDRAVPLWLAVTLGALSEAAWRVLRLRRRGASSATRGA